MTHVQEEIENVERPAWAVWMVIGPTKASCQPTREPRGQISAYNLLVSQYPQNSIPCPNPKLSQLILTLWSYLECHVGNQHLRRKVKRNMFNGKQEERWLRPFMRHPCCQLYKRTALVSYIT